MTYPAKITTALHEVMEACGYVQKKKRNEFHNYNYAGEGDLLDVLRPAMLKAGLLLIPSGKDRSLVDEHGNTHVVVEYTLAHKDGDVWPEKIRAFGSGNDRAKNGSVGDKGVYKALTGANKYLLFKLFQIETGDDPEAETHEPPPPAKPAAKPTPNPAFKVAKPKDPTDFVNRLGALIASAPDAATLTEIQAANQPALDRLKAGHETHWKNAMAMLSDRATDVLNQENGS